MGAGVAVGRQWAWPWSPGSLGPCPSGLLCSPGMLAPRSPAGTGCRSSSRSSTIQGPLPKGFTAQMAAVTGLHPDRLLQAATLPPHLQDQLSCKGPSRPASSPPLPAFPHKDGRVLAGTQAHILALLTCI